MSRNASRLPQFTVSPSEFPHPAHLLLAFANDEPHAREAYRDRVHPGRQRHEQHAPQHGGRHRGRPGEAYAGALVQRVPPLHREVDDRHVDHADQCQHRAGAVGAARVVDRGLEGDEADVEKEQDQFGRQPCVPHPPGAPGRLAPQRAAPQREEGEQCPGGGDRGGHHPRKPGVEDEAERAPQRHHDVEEHRHPRRRHVQEDDAVGLALLEVGRRDEEAEVQAGEREHHGQNPEIGNQSSCQREERLRCGIAQPPAAARRRLAEFKLFGAQTLIRKGGIARNFK